jgi:hypothetical protein
MGSILLDAFICYEFRGISRCAYNYIPKHTLASTVSSLRKKRVSKEGNRKCQMAQDQFIVGTVIKNTNQKDFSKNS